MRAQIAMGDSPAGIHIARAVVDAKIRKQVVVLQRFGRRDDAESAREATAMQRLLILILEANTSAEVMGLEGAAAAAYFPAYGQLFPEALQFTHRSRQPPPRHCQLRPVVPLHCGASRVRDRRVRRRSGPGVRRAALGS